MSIILALGSALAYGLSDFVGGLLTRRASAWAVAVLSQVASALVVLVAALVAGGAPTAAHLGWGAVSGIGSGLGTYFLYRGLGNGQMNVVAPLSAVGAAVVPVVVGVAYGERPAVLAWVGIVCALPAIWLVSRGGSQAAVAAGRATAGVRDGLLAGAGFGLLFLAIGQVPEGAGLWPLAAGQTVSVTILATGAVLARATVRGLPRSVLGGALLAGLAAAAATVLYQVAVRGELVSVTAVLASLYPALTVLLASFVLHERVHRTQAFGLALAAAAVAMVALA